jgi:hypothetical protein
MPCLLYPSTIPTDTRLIQDKSLVTTIQAAEKQVTLEDKIRAAEVIGRLKRASLSQEEYVLIDRGFGNQCSWFKTTVEQLLATLERGADIVHLNGVASLVSATKATNSSLVVVFLLQAGISPKPTLLLSNLY